MTRRTNVCLKLSLMKLSKKTYKLRTLFKIDQVNVKFFFASDDRQFRFNRVGNKVLISFGFHSQVR